MIATDDVYKMLSLIVFLLVTGGSPACAPVTMFGQQPAAHYDYPAPPQIGTEEQQKRLAELTREAASQVDAEQRATC